MPATYITETPECATVTEGQVVYDYYSMEPVIIGPPCGSDGWFTSLRADGSGISSSAGMLNGQRICTVEYARRRGFPGA